MLGSVNFDDPTIAGQVNVAISPRQPGSTLKPFTYVTAFSKGWSPATMMWDIPMTFPGGYKPTDFDNRFPGPLTVRDALAQSRNIPAVEALQFVTVPEMLATAHRLGITDLREPDRYDGLIVEAIHLDRRKPRSREFFLQMIDDPDAFGERVTRKLAEEHGEDYWRTIIRAGGRAWRDIAATPNEDFYERRLHDLRVPMLVVHGADDPRTEPGELDRIRREVPTARIEMIEGGGHSPHSTRATAAQVTAIVGDFLASLPRS